MTNKERLMWLSCGSGVVARVWKREMMQESVLLMAHLLMDAENKEKKRHLQEWYSSADVKRGLSKTRREEIEVLLNK